jgi:hypothetical protein
MTVSILLLTAALTAQQNAPVSSSTSAIGQPDDAQRRGQVEQSQSTGERPHTVGFGGQLGVSNRGAGAGTRFFFGDRFGVNLNAFWVRGNRYTTTSSSNGSTYGAFPSVIYMLTKPNRDRAVDVRPYLGGGVSYVSAPGRVTTQSGVISTERSSGMGQQAFGGVEVTLKEADWITFSAEEIYYRLPVRYVNSTVIDGFNYVVAVHFYLK